MSASKCRSHLRRTRRSLLARAECSLGPLIDCQGLRESVETRLHALLLLLPAASDDILWSVWCWASPQISSYSREFFEVVAGGSGPGVDEQHLCFPQRIALHSDGLLLVADWHNDRLVAWKEGRGQLVAGPSANVHGFTYAVCVDPRGSILASTYSGVVRIDHLDSEISVSEVIGEEADLHDHCGLCVDADGAVLVADMMNHRILRCPQSGACQPLDVTLSDGETDSKLMMPSDVAVLKTGELLICDQGSGRILQRLDNQKTRVLVSDLNRPYAISIAGCYLCVAEFGADRVVFFTLDGQRSDLAPLPVSRPTGIAVDKCCNLYVTERDQHRVLKFRPAFV